MSPFDKRVNAY